MLVPIFPPALENFAIRKEKHTLSVFESIQIFTFVPVAIRPRKHPKTLNQSILPLPIVLPVVHIRENAIAMKVAIGELTLENTRAAHIMPETRLNPMKELAFIIGAILKLLFSLAMRHIVLPLAIILIPLVRIVINATAIRLIIFYLAFIHTPIVITVPAFAMRDPFQKCPHIIRPVLKKELSLAMELIVLPLAMIVPSRRFDLLVAVGVHPVRVNLLSELVLVELLDLFPDHGGQCLLGLLFCCQPVLTIAIEFNVCLVLLVRATVLLAHLM
jgi:hypothetical protein